MVFTSIHFILFFPLLVLLYYCIAPKYRWLILLLASYFFYINIKPIFAILLASVTLFTYIFTQLMDKTRSEKKRKSYLIVNILVVLVPLFLFKYFADINNGLILLLQYYHLHWVLPEIKLLLPVGISFYSFMAIGYSVDVYNEDMRAEKKLGKVALFISFFPLILSGPIERAKNMLPQFNAVRLFDYELFVKGFKLMLWGYFMKLVVADRLGIYVDAVYSNLHFHNGTSILLAAVLYPFQVYADLGGYSLIAIGTANALGIKVMDNFKRPFFATTMSELWRRWHISLITWLTDYVYTPLSFAFRKYKVWGIVMALMITFFISGIWHGAAITFLVWGLMQGVFLSIEALTNAKKLNYEKQHQLSNKVWYRVIGILVTFVLFTASQIFGRASNITDAYLVFQKIFTSTGSLFLGTPSTLLYAFIGLSMLLIKDFTEEYYPNKLMLFNHKSKAIRYFSYSFIAIVILLIGVFDGGQFIYFQF